MKNYILLSGVDYKHPMRQRPQHFADFLAKVGNRVIFIPIYGTPHILNNERFVNLLETKAVEEFYKEEKENIFELNPIYRGKGNRKIGFGEVLALIQSLYGPENCVFVFCFPECARFIDYLSRESVMIYDCMDNWELFVNEKTLNLNHRMIRHERYLASECDIVLASAKKLYSKMKCYSDKVYYLPNGAYSKDYNEEAPVPKELSFIKSPVVLFVGTISDWVDIELIDYIARERPNYSFVYVGSTDTSLSLPERENIHYLGVKPYSQLAGYMNGSRVGIIPFKLDKLTLCVTPLKFFEYIFGGVPVVSTFLPDLSGAKGSRMALDYETFLRGIDSYVNMGEVQYDFEVLEGFVGAKKYEWDCLLSEFFSNIENIKNKEFKQYYSNEELLHAYENSDSLVLRNELLGLYNENFEFGKTISLGEEFLRKAELFDIEQLLYAYVRAGAFDRVLSGVKRIPSVKGLSWSKYISNITSLNSTEFLCAFCCMLNNKLEEAIEIVEGIISKQSFDELYVFSYALLCECLLFANHCDSARRILKYVIDDFNASCLEVFSPACYEDAVDVLLDAYDYNSAEKICLDLYTNEYWKDFSVKLLGDIYFVRSYVTANKAPDANASEQ